MKRLYVGLTLLLMSFLSALGPIEHAHRVAIAVGFYRWLPELVLAAAAVFLFVRFAQVHRRLLFPRRGQRLLAVGIALYAAAVAVATDVLVRALALVDIGQDSPLAALPELASALVPQPLFLLAQLLLVFGAFRALTNLVPPSEFEEDF